MDNKIKELEEKISKLSALLEQSGTSNSAQHGYRYQMNVPLPKSISVTGDVAASVKYFMVSWNNYKIACGLGSRPEKEQIAVLLSCVGEDCYRHYENFPLTAQDKTSTENILKAIEKYLVPKANKRYERAMFNLTFQQEGESIDAYVIRLKEMAKNCAYKCDDENCGKDLSDEFLLDKVCISIRDSKLRERLYDDSSLTLQRAIDKIKVAEMNEHQLNTLSSTSTYKPDEIANINKIKAKDYEQVKKKNNTDEEQRHSRCKFCGYRHVFDKNICPAYKKKCNQCGEYNHFASVCKSKKQKVKSLSLKTDRSVSSDDDDENHQQVVMKITHKSSKSGTLTAVLEFFVNEQVKNVECQLDTAATCNVIGYSSLCRIKGVDNVKLSSTKTVIEAFGGNLIKPLGQYWLMVFRHGKCHKLTFEVVKQDHEPLISSADCQRLEFIKVCKQIMVHPQNEFIRINFIGI